MTSFQTEPTVSYEDTVLLLDTIYNTYNVNGKINTFQMSKIVNQGMGNAIWRALRSTESKDGFQTELVKQCRAMYGIARTYNFEPDFTYNIDREKTRFLEDKIPTALAQMKKAVIYEGAKYGIKDTVTLGTAMATLDQMEFDGVTEFDENYNNRIFEDQVRQFVKEDATELKKEFPKMGFQAIIDAVIEDERYEKPEAISSFDRLKLKSEKSVIEFEAKFTGIYSDVMAVQKIEYPNVDINALHGTDGFTGNDRFKLIENILNSFDYSQRADSEKLGEIAFNPDMQKDEKMVKENLSSALVIIAMCNELITEARQVDNSNTSDEYSRVLEEGSSENISDAGLARQVFESENGLPHGTVGE